MSETNTTTEPTTETIKVRKTRTRKQSAPHITALKAAVSKALKNEWLLQQAIIKHSNACDRALAKVAKLTGEAQESWYAVQVRCVDCANAHQV
jgi:predicted hydrolase (HD superfamily)